MTVHSLKVAAYEYPKLVLDIECGSGTYVRSLGRDLARSLSTGAVMSALERIAVGVFLASDAVPGDALDTSTIAASLLPAQTALTGVAQVGLTEQEVADLRNGRPIGSKGDGGVEFAGIDAAGRLVAILTDRGKGLLWPIRVFPESV